MGILNLCSNAFYRARSSRRYDLPDDEIKQSLNYVWINKHPFESRDNELCGVPLKYLDRAIANANRYPHTKVNIWLDFDLLDASSLFFVASHSYLFGDNSLNITIRNLHEIPKYRKDQVFQPKGEELTDIWARVDYARLLVLRHVLKHDDVTDAFYSDFDVKDTNIQCDHVKACMNKYGLIFGGVKNGQRENGFLGFRSDEPTDFLERLIKTTRKMAKQGDDGFGVYSNAIRRWEKITRAQHYYALNKVLDRCGEVIPNNDLYIETKINRDISFR